MSTVTPLRITLSRLYIANVPWTIGKFELKNYFSQFGKVVNATVIFDRNTGMHLKYGFVSYRNRAELDAALNHPQHKLEGNILKVECQG